MVSLPGRGLTIESYIISPTLTGHRHGVGLVRDESRGKHVHLGALEVWSSQDYKAGPLSHT